MSHGGPFVCYRELISPKSAVVSEFFISNSVEYLFTASVSAITVYRVCRNKDVNLPFLSLCSTVTLFGRPQDAKVFTEYGSNSNNIVLTCDQGKIVLLKFDSVKQKLEEYKIFNAEDDAVGVGSELKANYRGSNKYSYAANEPFVDVDGASSLACILLSSQQLFFIPLQLYSPVFVPGRKSSLSNQNSEVLSNVLATTSGANRLSTFVIDALADLFLVGPIIDICFVDGFSKPALAILQDANPLPVGHAAQKLHTTLLTVITVDISQQSASILYQRNELPHDSVRVLNCKLSHLVGTVVVVSKNALLLVNMETVTGIAVNAFASITVHSNFKLQSWPLADAMVLDGSRWLFGDDKSLIGVTRDGHLIAFQFHASDSTENLYLRIRIEAELLGSTVTPSCICRNQSGSLWFIGSALSDSLLISCEKQTAEPLPFATLISNDVDITSWSVLGSSSTMGSVNSMIKSSKDPSTPSISQFNVPGLSTPVGVNSPSIGSQMASIQSGAQTPSDLTLPAAATPNTSNSLTTPAAKRVRRMIPRSRNEKDKTGGDGSGVTIADNSIAAEWMPNILQEEASLYGNVQSKPQSQFLTTSNAPESRFSLKIADVIPTIGPITGGLFSGNDESLDSLKKIDWSGNNSWKPASTAAAAYIAPREAKESLLLSTGNGQFGALHKVSFGLRLSKVATKEFPSASLVECFTLNDVAEDKSYRSSGGCLVVSFPDRTRSFYCHENQQDSGELSIREWSATESGLVTNCQTIAIAYIGGEHAVAQVFTKGVRIIMYSYGCDDDQAEDECETNVQEWHSEAMEEMLVDVDVDMGGLGGASDEFIISADISNSTIVILTSRKTIYVISFNNASHAITVSFTIRCNELENHSICQMDVDDSSIYHMAIDPVMVSYFAGLFPLPNDSQKTKHSEAESPRSRFRSHSTPGQLSMGAESSLASSHEDELQQFEETILYGNLQNGANSNDNHESPVGKINPGVLASPSADSAATNYFILNPEDVETKSSNTGKKRKSENSAAATTAVTSSCDKNVTGSLSMGSAYIVIGDATDKITILGMQHDRKSGHKLVPVMEIPNFSNMADILPITTTTTTTTTSIEESTSTTRNDTALFSKLKIRDVKLIRLQSTNDVIDQSKLCLVGLFDTGDFVIYHAVESFGSRNTVGDVFVKLEHTAVSHCHRSNKSNRLRKHVDQSSAPDDNRQLGNNGLGSFLEHDNGVTPLGINSSNAQAFGEEIIGFRLQRCSNFQGRNALLIPGPLPQALVIEHGFPSIVGISFPELPFSNSGRYCVAPLIMGSITGIVSIWHELTNSATVSNSETANSANRRLIGLYQWSSSDCAIYPGSVVTTKRLATTNPIKYCSELFPKTDDKTEFALLQKKTYVASTSVEVATPFVSNVMTDEEIEAEQQVYDRFIDDLTSFKQPDTSFGPAPKLVSVQNKVVLMHGGAIMDEYVLPMNEEVLGIEPLYLTLEKKADAAVINALNAAIGRNIVNSSFTRRVFVAVCTGVIDKHGEDTQGEGRLLFFSLDYKLTNPDINNSTASATDQATNASTAPTVSSADTTPPSNDTATVGASAAGVNVVGSADASSQPPQVTGSATQNMFLHAISPKLRLQWQGPGPSSVVKQFGENIIATVGATVYIYKLNPETLCLDQVSFFFAKFYVSSVSVLKNYIMICDAGHGVQFLVWREIDLSLTPLAQDFDHHVLLSSGFLWDGPSVGMIAADNEANLQMLQFNPKKIESIQGTRLLVAADFHLGSECNMLLTHVLPVLTTAAGASGLMPIANGSAGALISASQQQQQAFLNALRPPPKPLCPPGAAPGSGAVVMGAPFGSTLDKQSGNRSCIVTGSNDGSVGILIPIDEKVYRRLSLLYQIMTIGVPAAFAMNVKDYRTIKVSRTMLIKKRGILDGTLLWKFGCLPLNLQDEMAAVIGTTREVILENLTRIDKFCHFF